MRPVVGLTTGLGGSIPRRGGLYFLPLSCAPAGAFRGSASSSEATVPTRGARPDMAASLEAGRRTPSMGGLVVITEKSIPPPAPATGQGGRSTHDRRGKRARPLRGGGHCSGKHVEFGNTPEKTRSQSKNSFVLFQSMLPSYHYPLNLSRGEVIFSHPYFYVPSTIFSPVAPRGGAGTFVVAWPSKSLSSPAAALVPWTVMFQK